MGTNYLDFTFTLKGLRTRIVERPALSLAPDDLARLVSKARAVASSLQSQPLEYGPLSGRHEWLDKAVITLVEDAANGQPIGMSAMVILDCRLLGREVPVVHVGLTIVRPGYRGRGVSWRLAGFTLAALLVRRGLRPFWVSNVSQVPSAIGMFCEAMSQVYPWPSSKEPPSDDHLELARCLMGRHRSAFGVGADAAFDERRFVIENAYTGGSDGLKKNWEQVPLHRDPAINAACARELDYDRGDDFLQVGQMSIGASLRTATRALRAALAKAEPRPLIGPPAHHGGRS